MFEIKFNLLNAIEITAMNDVEIETDDIENEFDISDTLLDDPDKTVELFEELFFDTNPIVIDKLPESITATNRLIPGEEISFKVKYGFLNVGKAVFKLEKMDEKIRNRESLKISSTAKSTGLFNKIYYVNDRIISYVDAKHLFALKYLKIQREGNKKINEHISYNYDTREAISSRIRLRRGKTTLQNKQIPLEKIIYDPFGALYYLRNIDFEVGDIVKIPVSSSDSIYELQIKIKKLEKIKTAIGRIDCYVVSPLLLKEGIFLNKGDMDVWLTADERKIPVKMKSSIAIGSITAEIDSYKSGK